MTFWTPRLPAVILTIVVLASGSAATTERAGSRTEGSPSAAVAQTAAGQTELRQQWLEMFARGYFPGRSGQVFVVPREGDIITDRDPLYPFMHGSPWDYDTHIPILFHGAPFVKAGSWPDAASQQDIVPTIGTMIGAPTVSTYTGRTLGNALNRASGAPRVVSVLVFDAMRADYFDTYAGVMPTLTRLRREGAWFSNARATVLPTVTGVGHATIGTGTDPRIHGITVNTLFNRASGKPQPAYDALDPRELMALTLADAWNLATDGRAVIIGQGGAIRATAGLVGRGSCLIGAGKVIAASYRSSDGGWETNPECYTMPSALGAFQARSVWEAAGGRWMGHDIANGAKFRASSLYQKFEAEALLAVVNDSTVGADETTDLVMVNMKGPDYAAHAYGPDSAELKETLAELDRQMAAYIALMDKKAGPGRSVIVVTADHGTPGDNGPGRRHYIEEIIPLINARFDPEGKVVQYYGDAANSQIYLDTARLRSRGHSLKDVANMLEGLDYFVAAFTEDEVRAAQATLPGLNQIARAIGVSPMACDGEVERQIAEWRGGERRVAPSPASDGLHFVHPTDELGVWLDLRSRASGEVSLSRVSSTDARVVTWSADCRPQSTDVPVPAAALVTPPAFSDADLRAMVTGTERLAIYVWSPHMPLSVDGVSQFAEAARGYGVTTVAVLDPRSDPDYARAAAREAGLPPDATRVGHSIELAFQGAFVHSPAVMLFESGKPLGAPVPGYRDTAGYEMLLESLLNLNDTTPKPARVRPELR